MKISINKKVVFGGIVLIFAIIGLISSLSFIFGAVGDILNGSKTKEEMEWFITPVVMQDPPTFESPSEATNTTIITAGVWKFIMTQDTSKYPVDEFNFITVPQSDIEVQIKKIFGEISYTHETVGDTELMITYNSEAKSYIFPATPHVLPYTPRVDSVKRSGNDRILTVSYIPPGISWQGDITGNKYEPEPEKIMKYTLREISKGEYNLVSVGYPDEENSSDIESQVVEESIESEEISSEETQSE